MPQTMTLDEKLAIGCKASELRKAGDEEDNTQIAVKIVDDRGIESLKVISVGANG